MDYIEQHPPSESEHTICILTGLYCKSTSTEAQTVEKKQLDFTVNAVTQTALCQVCIFTVNNNTTKQNLQAIEVKYVLNKGNTKFPLARIHSININGSLTDASCH